MLRVKVKMRVPVPLEMYQRLHEGSSPTAADVFTRRGPVRNAPLDIRLSFSEELQ
jgi:hypothetical protein